MAKGKGRTSKIALFELIHKIYRHELKASLRFYGSCQKQDRLCRSFSLALEYLTDRAWMEYMKNNRNYSVMCSVSETFIQFYSIPWFVLCFFLLNIIAQNEIIAIVAANICDTANPVPPICS